MISFEGVGLGQSYTSYTASSGNIELWGNFASVANSTLIGYLVYGNTGVSSYQGSTGAWGSNFQAVYHLGNGTTLSLNDSTSNGHTLTNNATATATAGKISGGVSVNGSSQYLSVTGTTFASNPVTIMAWANTSDTTNVTTVAALGGGGGSPGLNFRRLFIYGPHSAHFSAQEQNIPTQGIAEDGAVTGSTWFQGTGAFISSTSRTAYLNASAGTNDTTSITQLTPTLFYIGKNNNTGVDEFFNGSIDEARVYSGTLPTGWVATEVTNQNSPGDGGFYTLGAETSCPAPPAAPKYRRIIAGVPDYPFPQFIRAEWRIAR
jgi:hypothetical protein